MLDGFLGRAMHWRVLDLRLLGHFTDDRLELEELHLHLRKCFSSRAILLDPHQPQSLFQHPNPQLRIPQPALQLSGAEGMEGALTMGY
jgi:hypothetical protein